MPVNCTQKIHVFLDFTMYFDHSSTRSNSALMSSLDNPESTMSDTTARTDLSKDTAATRTWATLLKSEFVEDGNNGTRPVLEQTETPIVA